MSAALPDLKSVSSTYTFSVTSTQSYTTACSEEEVRSNNSDDGREMSITKGNSTIEVRDNLKDNEAVASYSLSKRTVSSISDDEVHGRGRIPPIEDDDNTVTSTDDGTYSIETDNYDGNYEMGFPTSTMKSKIPRPVLQIKASVVSKIPEKVTNAPDHIEISEESSSIQSSRHTMKNVSGSDQSKVSILPESSEKVKNEVKSIKISEESTPSNQSSPTILENISGSDQSKCTIKDNSDAVSSPTLVKRLKTLPKRKPYTPLKGAAGKVAEKDNSTQKLPRKPIKAIPWPLRQEGLNQSKWSRRRSSPSKKPLEPPPAKANPIPIKDVSSACSGVTGTSCSSEPSHKLATLEARYKFQLKRYNAQNKELLGMTVQLEGTKKTLLTLDKQIKNLGGTLPMGDVVFNDSPAPPVSPLKHNTPVTSTGNKVDKSILTESKFSDNAFKLKEENKALLQQLEKLQGENSYKNAWLTKYMQEMKDLEESSKLTDVTCFEALHRQDELHDKLNLCDKALGELAALTKDALLHKSTALKLKTELNEERIKLESERNSKNELENKLNQDLAAEKVKVRAERAKRESLQGQLMAACKEKTIASQERDELANRLKELEDQINSNDPGEASSIANLQQALKDKDAYIQKVESYLIQLNETKEILENQIVEMDLGSKSTHSSVVEMSKQLLNKDEQLSDLKKQRDQAFNENSIMIELLYFIATTNSLDLSNLNIAEISNNPDGLNVAKDKIKEAFRKRSSSITDSLVREQAEQIKEQSINIQNYVDEVNRVNEKNQELQSLNNSRDREINLLKDENVQLLEKLKIMESLKRSNIAMRGKDESFKDLGGNDSTNDKVTFDQLLSMLVAKGEALARMESKVKQLELVHSMCARRRARGESRIAHLESILKNDPTCWEEVIISN